MTPFGTALGQLSNLEELKLWLTNSNIPADSIGGLAKGLSNLKNLKIFTLGTSEFVDVSAESCEKLIDALSGCKDIVELGIGSGVGFSDKTFETATKAIGEWKGLNSFAISCQDASVSEKTSLELISAMKKLEKIREFSVALYTYGDSLCLSEDVVKKLQNEVDAKKLAKGVFTAEKVEYDSGH